MKKRVAVLGATGSIGKSTLDVLRNQRDFFEPVLFSARSRSEELLALKKEFPRAIIALADTSPENDEDSSQPGVDFSGKRGLLDAIYEARPDITVNGISGAAGLEPSAAVLNSGSDLALANKETVVMAGRIIFDLAKKNNASIFPVDSEHTAVFKLLEAHGRDKTREIIITASGGPFRNYSLEELSKVTPQEALAHPTWNMGPKITVDSASLANKGLEVIEASGYFGFPPEKIKVVIHPQSIVHSMIRMEDGAVYAQMSKPDMRLTIHEILAWPETRSSPFGILDFDSLSLNFEKPDFERFPMLALAYDALEKTFLPAVYNAANEIAVEAFFHGRIKFLEIPGVVSYVLNKCRSSHDVKQPELLETVLEWDKKAREMAKEKVGSCNAA